MPAFADRSRRSQLRRAGYVAKVVAIAFGVGALVHSTGLVLLLFGNRLYGPIYPWWRHAAMIAADLAVSIIAVRRPDWLVPVLSTFLLEQIVVNGVGLGAGLVAAALAAVAFLPHRRLPRGRSSLD